MSASPKGRTRARSALFIALSGVTLLACSEQTPVEPPAADLAPQFHHSKSPPPTPEAVGWQELARSLVGTNNFSPLAAARAYALVSVAQYGAIKERNEHKRSHNSEFERGAVAGASWVVLAFVFPASAIALEQRVADEKAAAGPGFSDGVEEGKKMGERLVAWAKADRFTVPFTGPIPTGPGIFVPVGTPAGGTLGGMAPYFLTSGSQFRSPEPPAFNSRQFLKQLAEIRTLSDTQTPEQLAMAIFWNFPGGTPTPPGYWNQVASDFILKYRLNEREATHVLALTTVAMMDALIGCWDAKFFYWYIRPWEADAAITLPLGRPNHPSYPSGHSCVSAAATTVLSDFFPKETRQLNKQLEEAGLSRMYGGIHYRFDIDAGAQLGKSVAKYAIRFDERKGLLFRIP